MCLFYLLHKSTTENKTEKKLLSKARQYLWRVREI